ncbi:TasA family protein [Kocuria sp. NPDC057446]|uniref:TasA family protein n=1 Tax=Kocuria sp. NPDC057446 TaxID=3346137 RepID=UPI0036B9E03E
MALTATLAGTLVVGGTAWAVFTAADTSTASVASGAVDLEWDDTGLLPLALQIGPLYPGESTEQLVNLDHQGTVPVTEMQLAYTGTDSAPTNPSDGIQMALEECSLPWAGTGQNTACPGITTTLAPDRPVTGRTDLSTTAATTPGATSHLRFTFRRPDSSPTEAQGTSTTLEFTVLGNQRPGQQR